MMLQLFVHPCPRKVFFFFLSIVTCRQTRKDVYWTILSPDIKGFNNQRGFKHILEVNWAAFTTQRV